MHLDRAEALPRVSLFRFSAAPLAFTAVRGWSDWNESRSLLPQRHTSVRAVHLPLLPEGLSCELDSSLGVHQRTPLRRHKCVASTPGWPKPTFGASLPTSRAFRPCRSSRLRRLPPLHIPQVCCTLQPTMGFAQFRAGPRGCKAVRIGPPLERGTLRSFHRLDSLAASPGLPLFTAVRPFSSLLLRAHRTLLHGQLPVPRPQGFAPSRKSVTTRSCCHERPPDAPMGLVLTWTFGRVHSCATEVAYAHAAPKCAQRQSSRPKAELGSEDPAEPEGAGPEDPASPKRPASTHATEVVRAGLIVAAVGPQPKLRSVATGRVR